MWLLALLACVRAPRNPAVPTAVRGPVPPAGEGIEDCFTCLLDLPLKQLRDALAECAAAPSPDTQATIDAAENARRTHDVGRARDLATIITDVEIPRASQCRKAVTTPR
jgi:hypothetical protein